ncbi:MAG TPA: isocitrate lyase/phosphoenolpyruvate mutase family protein [bacterium]|nr:isocitrate lyase/phosphoenolpyruvate mutase family protein [bacterium]
MNTLHSQLHTARGLQFVGVPSALCARLIERHGYDGLYLSGAVLSQFVHGMADDGTLTLEQVADFAREIGAASGLPMIVDADTGFGQGAEGTDVSACVQALEGAGVAAIQIEDQVEAKLCGHLDGKQLVPTETMCAKLRSAVAARRDPALVLIARTDARGVTGWDDALARARAYREAGADMIFIEALPAAEEFQAFAEACPGPLMANMTEFGKTPLLERDQLAAYGYTAIIYPGLLMRTMLAVADEALDHLQANGQQRALLSRMWTRQQLYDLIAYDHAVPTPPDAAD